MIVVIGGGPAGRYAAMRLSGAGKKVRLVEKRSAGVGGQCLHQGCMTICALNDVARLMEQARGFQGLGILGPISEFSYKTLIHRMQETIRIIAGVLEQETVQAGVEIIHGSAEIQGSSLLIDGVETPADAIIIASGAHPKIPEISGCCLPGVYTAHTLLSMPDLPKKMVIIGSGVIAAEFAYIFRVFGSEVTILARSSLLRTFPDKLVHEARKDLAQVTIEEEVTVAGITGQNHVTGVIIRDKEGIREIPADVVLLAAGMVPNTGFISGITCDPNGALIVNDRMETSAPGVYAAGDVTGTGYLTPVARHQGRKAADAILGNSFEPEPVAVPQAIKLKHDLAYCRKPGNGSKGISIPGPAGPGTFWEVQNKRTGSSSIEFDENGDVMGLSEASPAASVAMAYLGWMMNSDIRIEEFDRFIEVHPSADGIPWLLKYLNGKRKS
ncbi:NAD(P)/FAD-dependent oxidoreductase [Methanospirillum sp. J.3.6.1-F.2.7.3]|uniref:NAD(P)/FAD-dependent oxidoreductase n=1 Tax=Methanospirillum purgamenti TaxID=2834276 RepID=A0A8E7AZE0_9EURY|nr:MULTISPECIES: NAD(P)/FAD-dependent oxidoreductase [Methanospirillum]MDX8549777.1 NAD(P)/FAD-dependent oxidoreductase [Methanospirillum hungatei]QVV89590.1 NAD(P)/FAD-dependent oxidoreductase [Methanospirillum sp. J.3.6.1-F.2.7.3]